MLIKPYNVHPGNGLLVKPIATIEPNHEHRRVWHNIYDSRKSDKTRHFDAAKRKNLIYLQIGYIL